MVADLMLWKFDFREVDTDKNGNLKYGTVGLYWLNEARVITAKTAFQLFSSIREKLL